MSNNCFKKCIKELDKDTEDFLTKVLKRNIDKPRSSSRTKSRQNVSRDRTVRPFLTGPSSRPQSSSAGLKENPPVLNKPINGRLLHKELIENSSATVEVTVKTKSKDKINRKRSLSSSHAVLSRPDNNRAAKGMEDAKQININDPLSRNKTSSRVHQHKLSRSKSPKPKQLSWSQVLKENKSTRYQETVDVCNLISKPKCCIDINAKTRLDNKVQSIFTKPVIKSRTGADVYEEDNRRYLNVVESKHMPSAASSSSRNSSGFSSSAEEVECANKSVQCWLPPPNNLHVDSTTTVSSTKIGDEGNLRRTRASMVDAFSMFNPVRTLNFLVKELHGIIKKCPEDQNLQRIIVDMEKALLRIPPEIQGEDAGGSAANVETYMAPLQNADTAAASCNSSGLDSTTHKVSDIVTQQQRPPSSTQESFAKTLSSVPALALKVDSSVVSTLETSAKTSLSTGVIGLRSDSSALLLQKQLEDSCAKLEAMCQQMEMTCNQLREERDQLEEDVKQKTRELEIFAGKEQDYLTTIARLRTNLESSGRTMSELTALTAQLREENKALPELRESQYKLNQQLQESIRSKEQLCKDIQLMQLEREKMHIINQGKDIEVERFKHEITDIKSFVMEQLRTSIREKGPSGFSSCSIQLSNDTDLDSMPSDLMQFITTPRRPICSSPTSSKTSSIKVDSSWQRISSITRLQSNQSAPELLVLSPIKEKGSSSTIIFKSMEVDSMVEISDISDRDEISIDNPTVVPAQSKATRELKFELKSMFEEMRKQSKISSSNISVPSPPHKFEAVEPGEISQWSESAMDSSFNSAVLSASDLVVNQEEGY